MPETIRECLPGGFGPGPDAQHVPSLSTAPVAQHSTRVGTKPPEVDAVCSVLALEAPVACPPGGQEPRAMEQDGLT